VPFRTSSRNPPVETTPLPPRTPTKAAKLLGVPPGRARVESPLVAQHDGVFDRDSNDDDIDEPTRPRDPYGWEQQYTDTASVASSDTLTNRAREEDLDPNPPKSKSFWGSSKNKAKELLESLSPRRTSTELPSHVSMASSFSTPAYKYEDESLTNLIHSIGSNQPNHPIRDPPSPPTRSAPLPPARRRKSKRKPGKSKFNNVMSPITETSRGDTSAHGKVAQDTLRDAVSSDTPTDESAEKEKMMVHGKPMELSRAQAKLPVRSPLQTLEADCLTAAELAHIETVKEGHEQMKTEGNLPLRSSHQALVEADLLTAAEAAHMETVKEGHEQMKKDFAALTCRDCERGLIRKDGDAVSISISIGLDEDPTVHTAVAMTYCRVLPGEVKLVDIPARKVCSKSTRMLRTLLQRSPC
jgi:hypothetical protein